MRASWILSAILIDATGALLSLAQPGHAVNCDKNPNHSQCGGSGGSGGGGSKPGGSALAVCETFLDRTGDAVTSDSAMSLSNTYCHKVDGNLQVKTLHSLDTTKYDKNGW